MITAHHLVFGRKYGGIAYWLVNTNIANPTAVYFGISTKNGNIEIDWKDGTPKTTYTTSKNIDSTLSANNSTNLYLLPHHYFPANFIASVELNCLGGLNDVYSLYFGGYGMVINQDFGSFINQFASLYSLNIDIPHSVAYLNGDVSQIPNSVEKFYIRDFRNSGNLYLNISNFNINSQLNEFKSIDGNYNHNGFTNVYGDLAKLPPLIKIFTLKDNLANTLTYTSGKIWASSFDTLDIGNASLSVTDTDNLLIDMANSITTAIGSKVIRLANCYRTTASNSAVAYLQSLGFTITVLAIGIDTSTFLYSEISGVNAYLPLTQNGTLSFTTDRKGGNTAIQFSSGYLKTLNNLPDSSVWSISFWMKNNSNSVITVFGGESGVNNSQTFNFVMNDAGVNYYITIKGSSFNRWRTSDNLKDNIWHHYVFILDRTKLANEEIQVYIDGVKKNTIQFSSSDSSGNFVSSRINFGQQLWTGSLDDIKLYNRPLTQTEITNLYNE